MLDAQFLEALRREAKVLRYLAHITVGEGGHVEVRAGPEAVPADEAAGRLVGVEAHVAFTTARHADRPLVVQGAGVGGASTAGGVIAEIFRLRFGHGAR